MMLKWFGHVGRGLEGGGPHMCWFQARREEKIYRCDEGGRGDGVRWATVAPPGGGSSSSSSLLLVGFSCSGRCNIRFLYTVHEGVAASGQKREPFLPAFKFYFLSSTSCSFVGDTGDRFLKVGARSSCGSNSFLGHMFHIWCQGLM